MSRLALVAATGALAACASSSSTGGGAAAELELLTYDADLQQTAVDAVSLSCPWELTNPTADKASVGKITWSLEIEGESTTQGEMTAGTSANAGSKTEGTLDLGAKLAATAEAFAAREAKAALLYTLRASFEIAGANGTEIYDAEWIGEFFPPKKPEVTLKAEAGRYGDKGFELNFIIGIYNPNPFTITVAGLDYTLTVVETELSKDVLAKGKELPPSSEFQFDVQRFVGQDDLHELATQLKKMDSIPYAFAGSLSMKGIEIPVPISGEITFAR